MKIRNLFSKIIIVIFFNCAIILCETSEISIDVNEFPPIITPGNNYEIRGKIIQDRSNDFGGKLSLILRTTKNEIILDELEINKQEESFELVFQCDFVNILSFYRGILFIKFESVDKKYFNERVIITNLNLLRYVLGFVFLITMVLLFLFRNKIFSSRNSIINKSQIEERDVFENNKNVVILESNELMPIERLEEIWIILHKMYSENKPLPEWKLFHVLAQKHPEQKKIFEDLTNILIWHRYSEQGLEEKIFVTKEIDQFQLCDHLEKFLVNNDI